MIRAENVCVRFTSGLRRRRVDALVDLSLHVREGDCYALVGANGAGKSTALYCFLGLIRPGAGRVTVLGKTPSPGDSSFRRIGYVPEEPHYHLYLTVREALAFYAALGGTRPDRSRIDAFLERFQLTEAASRPLSKCSKGMRQKLGIAACLIGEPVLMLLDEPTRGLDPFIVREVRAELTRARAGGATVVMNTHLLSEVEQLATRVALLDRGRLVVEETPDRLTLLDREVYEAEFAGSGDRAPAPEATFAEGIWRCMVPAEELPRTLSDAAAAGYTLLLARLKRRSLEESLLDRVREKTA